MGDQGTLKAQENTNPTILFWPVPATEKVGFVGWRM
jgi:hypothetical protein